MTKPVALPRVRISHVIVALAALYSIARFLKSGVLDAIPAPGADFRSAFPGPLIFDAAAAWPWLHRSWMVPWFVPSTEIWNYGPVLHFLTFPLVLAPTKEAALLVVLAVNEVLVAASLWLWIRLLVGGLAGLRRVAAALVVACIWMNHFPLLEAISGREIEVLELFLVTLALRALLQGRQTAAGVAIGTAAMTKFLPVIFVPYLLLKGFRKACWVSLATMAAIGIPAQLLLGFENSLTLRVGIGGMQAHYSPSAYANQAIVNVLYKMFTLFDKNVPHPVTLYPEILWPIGMAIQTVVLLACWWWLWRHRRSRLLDIEMALLLLIMVLTAPRANTYYMVFALPALSIGAAAWIQTPQAMSRALKAALVAAVALCGFVVPMRFLEPVVGWPGVVIARVLQLYSFPAFGAILAALVMVGLHQARSEASS